MVLWPGLARVHLSPVSGARLLEEIEMRVGRGAEIALTPSHQHSSQLSVLTEGEGDNWPPLVVVVTQAVSLYPC